MFIDFDIWNRMAPLQMLYSVTLTYFFKAIIANGDIFETVTAS